MRPRSCLPPIHDPCPGDELHTKGPRHALGRVGRARRHMWSQQRTVEARARAATNTRDVAQWGRCRCREMPRRLLVGSNGMSTRADPHELRWCKESGGPIGVARAQVMPSGSARARQGVDRAVACRSRKDGSRSSNGGEKLRPPSHPKKLIPHQSVLGKHP